MLILALLILNYSGELLPFDEHKVFTFNKFLFQFNSQHIEYSAINKDSTMLVVVVVNVEAFSVYYLNFHY